MDDTEEARLPEDLSGCSRNEHKCFKDEGIQVNADEIKVSESNTSLLVTSLVPTTFSGLLTDFVTLLLFVTTILFIENSVEVSPKYQSPLFALVDIITANRLMTKMTGLFGIAYIVSKYIARAIVQAACHFMSTTSSNNNKHSDGFGSTQADVT